MRGRERERGDLTPVKRRRLERSLEILESPAEGIAYQHTVLCQTCLPYKNPGALRTWERKQGAVKLRIEAGAVSDPKTDGYREVGLPYGSRPRLILAHLNREALLSGSPRIDVGRSLTAFVKRIQDGRGPRGIQIRRFKEQLTRFAAATVRMSVDIAGDRAYQVNTHIIDTMELWLEKGTNRRILWPETVELSARYFESLTAHAVPLDERAIGALANSPMALDVYAWLAQRLCRVKEGHPQFVAWANLYDQFGQGFTRIRKFRETFFEVLMQVSRQYTAAAFDVNELGMTLEHSPPPVLKRQFRVVDM